MILMHVNCLAGLWNIAQLLWSAHFFSFPSKWFLSPGESSIILLFLPLAMSLLSFTPHVGSKGSHILKERKVWKTHGQPFIGMSNAVYVVLLQTQPTAFLLVSTMLHTVTYVVLKSKCKKTLRYSILELHRFLFAAT